MSTPIRRIPRAERLQVVTVHKHETVIYAGSIHDFIRKIMDEGWSGRATFTVNQGRDFIGLTFDRREKMPIDTSNR